MRGKGRRRTREALPSIVPAHSPAKLPSSYTRPIRPGAAPPLPTSLSLVRSSSSLRSSERRVAKGPFDAELVTPGAEVDAAPAPAAEPVEESPYPRQSRATRAPPSARSLLLPPRGPRPLRRTG
ncbi:hypothetical protein B0H17DRAFT_1061716 [Mycena rosella]|uniref:Uncharacterized protein n=1 Tax=Mycena rosella TaxID=1033263 RepID=A0AAD7GJQ7_MYCRO|nr:hypothetical protein B0H17DRAFT_1061716 [Mycena rosella]